MAAETMTAGELTNLRLGTLDTTVSDWEKMYAKLNTLATGSGGEASAKGLETKANAADWKGDNATVTKAFVTKTAGEFRDVAAQAKSVLGILRDASAALKKHKTDLQTLIDEVAKKNIYINDNGTAIASVPSGAAAGKGDIPKPTDEEVAVAERRVKRILWEASETDRIAARALRALAKDKHDFSGDGPGGLKEADDRQGKADADYWAKKAAETNPKDWSDADIARFDETLVNQRDNPGFSERFATTLGAEGTLQFWRDMAAPPGGAVEGERAKILAQVQDNLSMTLATATQSDSPAMDTWKRDVIAAGGKTFGHEGMMAKAYGFQIMSNLMVKGNFDSGFLRDYGNAMRIFETDTKKPFDPASIWGNPGMAAQLDYSGKDGASGSDPMSGYLKAVSHNPDFATELFNREDMADYLLSEREFYDEDDPFGKGDGTIQSRDALGKALLAAGTGINPDVPHVVTSYDHTEAQRDVLDGALRRLAGEGDDFPPELRDDMAALLLNYGDETHHSASALADDPGDPRLLDRHDLMEVSKQVSRSQDAYGILNDGLNQEMLRDIHEDNPKDPKETLIRAGQTVGFLEEARYQALNTDKDDPTWDAKWGYHGFGGAANFIPVVGDAAQRGVDALAYQWQLDEQGRIDKETQRQNGDTFTSRENQLKALAEEWGRANPGHTNSDYTLTDEINRAAFNGNDRASGLAGDQ